MSDVREILERVHRILCPSLHDIESPHGVAPHALEWNGLSRAVRALESEKAALEARAERVEARVKELGGEVVRVVCVLTEKLNMETTRAEKAEADLTAAWEVVDLTNAGKHAEAMAKAYNLKRAAGRESGEPIRDSGTSEDVPARSSDTATESAARRTWRPDYDHDDEQECAE